MMRNLSNNDGENQNNNSNSQFDGEQNKNQNNGEVDQDGENDFEKEQEISEENSKLLQQYLIYITTIVFAAFLILLIYYYCKKTRQHKQQSVGYKPELKNSDESLKTAGREKRLSQISIQETFFQPKEVYQKNFTYMYQSNKSQSNPIFEQQLLYRANNTVYSLQEFDISEIEDSQQELNNLVNSQNQDHLVLVKKIFTLYKPSKFPQFNKAKKNLIVNTINCLSEEGTYTLHDLIQKKRENNEKFNTIQIHKLFLEISRAIACLHNQDSYVSCINPQNIVFFEKSDDKSVWKLKLVGNQKKLSTISSAYQENELKSPGKLAKIFGNSKDQEQNLQQNLEKIKNLAHYFSPEEIKLISNDKKPMVTEDSMSQIPTRSETEADLCKNGKEPQENKKISLILFKDSIKSSIKTPKFGSLAHESMKSNKEEKKSKFYAQNMDLQKNEAKLHYQLNKDLNNFDEFDFTQQQRADIFQFGIVLLEVLVMKEIDNLNQNQNQLEKLMEDHQLQTSLYGNLVKKMLTWNPEDRIKISEILDSDLQILEKFVKI